MRLVVMDDVNVHRGISRERVLALKARERANGVVAVAHYATVRELLATVGNPKDDE